MTEIKSYRQTDIRSYCQTKIMSYRQTDVQFQDRYRQTKISSYRPNHLMLGYTEKAWSRMPATRTTFDDLPKEIQNKIMADRARQQVNDVTYVINKIYAGFPTAKLMTLCLNNGVRVNKTSVLFDKYHLMRRLYVYYEEKLTKMGFFWLGYGRLGWEANEYEMLQRRIQEEQRRIREELP